MDWIVYMTYPLLLLLLLFGVRVYGRGRWNEEWLSLGQTKLLQGFMAVLIMFHHMAQKTCAPWHEQRFIVHGLDLFVPIGYFFVGVFLFFSGFGLYKSVRTKPDYLKGFPRRRILPIVAAFYVSEWLFLAVRALMGERMDWKQVVWYATGAQLANSNAWYVIALPFFYLFFYAAFRLCKRDGWALTLTTVLILGYITLGTFIDHNDWWMRGEWWYNTAHFFPLGLLAARFEQPLTRAAKKHWCLWVALAVVGTFVFFQLSELATNVLSYYGENWHAPDKVLRRWGCLGTQMLASTSFVCAVLLLGMKVRIGNGVLKWLGGMTMELYLIHGLFVELFGYDFLEVRPSLVYIRNVPLYVLAVIACTVPAAILFRLLLKPIDRWLTGQAKMEKAKKSPLRRMEDRARRKALAAKVLRCLILIAVTVSAAFFLVMQVVVPGVRYMNAERLRANGQYEKAAAAFADLGSYRDAEAQITETYYQQAKALADSNDAAGAAAVFNTIRGYRDVDALLASDEKLVAAAEYAAACDARFAVGNIVSFGSYPQAADGTDDTPIEWLVLDRDRQYALLISRYALDRQPYNSAYADVTWETCTLRAWMNGAFIERAFSAQEQRGVITSAVENSAGQGFFSTDGGADTRDRVFLLSHAEAWKYFKNSKGRMCQPTAYAAAQHVNVAANGNCRWWLRSPGSSPSSACSIGDGGTRRGNFVHEEENAVRPAMWVDLGSGVF